MARIIIDGYNVIGVMHRDLEAERKRFIEALSAYGKRKSHEITVVFDGWKEGGARQERRVEGGVEVVFSALGVKADAVIEKLLAGPGVPCIVVSSDREVQRFAWSSGSTPVGSPEFLRALEGGGEAGQDSFTDRGKPSRKLREQRRALAKL